MRLVEKCVFYPYNLSMKQNKSPARTVIEDVCRVKRGERCLIIANPETRAISDALFLAARGAGAVCVLIIQEKKTTHDFADEAVIAAIKSEPDVILSVSHLKLGRDAAACAHPYKTADGRTFDSTFDYLLSGKKTIRAAWTPGITGDMFRRTVNIDYELLRSRCVALSEKFKGAAAARVTAPGGTDITIGLAGRSAMSDDGDFGLPGLGGNIPSGEVYLSPAMGASRGIIVFDGSMTFSDGDALLSSPIKLTVENGFITTIEGGADAERLRSDIERAERDALEMESRGNLPAGQGKVYARNARNIGELGIGLNEGARITGNMLEDEKAFKTCHFAVGENYDDDAPSLIHFDGIVREPTIIIQYENGKTFTVLDKGDLRI